MQFCLVRRCTDTLDVFVRQKTVARNFVKKKKVSFEIKDVTFKIRFKIQA